jgi:stage II sporulation protein D
VPAVAGASGTIRVAVATDVPHLELRGTGIEIAEIGACERCQRWQADVVRAVSDGTGVDVEGRRGLAFRLRSDGLITANGREYAGGLDVLRAGHTGLLLVNELPLEDYVAGVVRAEMGDRWPSEALRAQAVVARTYAAYHRMIGAGKPYHILSTTAHQQYAGRPPVTSAAWDAARDTAGVVLRWEGELFPAFYHTESGGFTEDPRTVFAARNMPALRPVRCPFSAGGPHYYWNLDLRLSEVGDLLRRSEIDVGTPTAIHVSERTPSLRAMWVTVRGTRSTARLRGNDFRRLLGYDRFKSTLFAVALDGPWARFSGRGYGHGVGLCQWGAKGMAEQGHAAPRILAHYYPGATLGMFDR